jgi:hypothetical protein
MSRLEALSLLQNRPARHHRTVLYGTLACLALAAAGCAAPDPKAEMELVGLETYWAVDSPSGTTQYLAPVVRFDLRNKGQKSRSVQAMATLRRDGEAVAWSSAFTKVIQPHGEVAPGATAPVLLKPEGEGRYTSTGPPEGMFQHPQWKDVSAELFLRVDNSEWTRFGTYPIERHIGSKEVAP